MTHRLIHIYIYICTLYMIRMSTIQETQTQRSGKKTAVRTTGDNVLHVLFIFQKKMAPGSGSLSQCSYKLTWSNGFIDASSKLDWHPSSMETRKGRVGYSSKGGAVGRGGEVDGG